MPSDILGAVLDVKLTVVEAVVSKDNFIRRESSKNGAQRKGHSFFPSNVQFGEVEFTFVIGFHDFLNEVQCNTEFLDSQGLEGGG